MSKIFNYYTKNKDGIDTECCWYKSSNVIYTECIDKENEPKILKVVFSNGTQYQYDGVNVNDYLVFRESASQGKALNRLIKENGYKYTKLENADLEKIKDELFFRQNNGFYLKNSDCFEIKNNKDESVFKMEKTLDDETFKLINEILESVGLNVKNVL